MAIDWLKGPYTKALEQIEAAMAGLKAAEGAQNSKGVASPQQEKMQASFGKDLSGVKAHAGGGPAQAAKATSAAAFASGNHVAFKGSPNMHTAAHEAAHVVQQSKAGKAANPKAEAAKLAHELANSSLAPHQGRVVVSPPSSAAMAAKAATAATVEKALASAHAAIKGLAALERKTKS